MHSQERRSFLYRLALLAVCGSVLCLWVAFDLPCLLRRMTGFPCISCGMSRAWLSALRLDMVSAFQYHPMFWSVPVLALMFLFTGEKVPRWQRYAYGAVLLGFVVCYIIRLAAHIRELPLV